MIPPERLGDLATVVLATVEDYYAAEGVDLPDRRFVADGTPAVDCDQLTVYVEGTFRGDPDAPNTDAEDCLPLRSARVAVLLMRCSPNVPEHRGDTVYWPDPAAVQAHAMDVLADATLLWNAVQAAHQAGQLGARLAFQTWDAVGPAGGYSGGLLRFRVSLAEAFDRFS